MQIEELNNYVVLFDIYGKLLSRKQEELMNEFLNFNLSESELAESTGASRQAVHDAIAKAKKQLAIFEDKCGIAKSIFDAKQKLIDLKKIAKENKDALCLIDNIIENL